MENLDRLLAQAEQFINKHQYTEAKPILKQVLSSDPKNAQAWYLVSQCINDTRQKTEALQRALTSNPNHKAAKLALQQLSPVPDTLTNVQPKSDVPIGTRPRIPMLLIWGAMILIVAVIAVFIASSNNQSDLASSATLQTLFGIPTATLPGTGGTPDLTTTMVAVRQATQIMAVTQTYQAYSTQIIQYELAQQTAIIQGQAMKATYYAGQTATALAKPGK